MSARRSLALGAALGVAGCTDFTPSPADVVGSQPTSVPAPADNPTTPEAVELGRLLYWDPILSGDRDVACATCHHPAFAYSDGLPVSIGVGGRGIGPVRGDDPDAPRVPRNSQTVLGAAWNGVTWDGATTAELAPMFWDRRAHSLEEQALEPIKSELEMRGTSYAEDEILDEVVARLAELPGYVELFDAAYGDEGISAGTLAKAIAAFERTLVPTPSSFDRYMAGDDDALTSSQIRGLHGFVTQGCSRCHSGPMFSDYQLHRLPIPTRPGDPPDDGDGSYRFRTPSLRMVTLTAPYMHHGIFATLDEVFDSYHNLAHDLPDGETLDPLLEGDVEVAHSQRDDLIAFFAAISDGEFDRTVPASVPSGLPPGGL